MTRVRTWQRRVSLEEFCQANSIPLANKHDLTSIFIYTLPAISLGFCKIISPGETDQWSMHFWSKRRFLRRLGLPEDESRNLINAHIFGESIELRFIAS